MEKLISLDANTLQTYSDRPESITTQDIWFQIAVASHPDTPRNLLEILANSDTPEVAEAARLHVNYAGELNKDWQEVVDNKLKSRYMGQNDRLAVELLKIAPLPAYFLSEYVPPEYLIQGLNNPYLPLRYRLQLLARLAQEPTLEPRLQVAESPDTPLPVLEQLIGDLELPIRIAVQYNTKCPSELVELVTGQHNVASNWDTDSQQLDDLSNSNWDWIRLAVARNPSAAEETLLKLAGDKVFRIQLAVANNPVNSARVLAVLAEHSSKEIQAAVAKHPNATEEILHNLFDTQQGVIKSRENLPASILERIFNELPKNPQVPLFLLDHGGFIYFFIRQPNTPTWILAEFANIDLEKLRTYAENQYKNSPIKNQIEGWIGDRCGGLAKLAKHPQVSKEILEKLAEFPNQKVKLAVAQNPKTSEGIKLQIFEILSVDPDRRIRTEVAKDANTPVSILEAMARRELYLPKLLQEIRRVLASEYPENSRSYETTADVEISYLKHKILYPANVSIDVENWMEILENSDILEIMANNTRYEETRKKFNSIKHSLETRWRKLLVGLSEEAIEKVIRGIIEALSMVNGYVKNHQFMRSVAIALIGNYKTPANLREKLRNQLTRISIPLKANDSDRDIFMALAYNLQVSETDREKYLQRLITEGNCAAIIAKNPSTPVHILEQVFELRCELRRGDKILEALAKNYATPESLLRKIADLRREYLWRVLAENPHTPSDLLIRFITEKVKKTVHSNRSMLDLVLANPNLPILNRYQILLEQEEQKEIQQANQILVKRIDSPYALARVLETGDQNAKISAARNRKTPVRVLEQLAKDEDETVRQTVAQNPNISLEIAEQLAQDTSSIQLSLVRSKIELSPEILHRLVQTQNEFVCKEIAKNKNTPAIILRYLVFNKKYRVEVLKNPNTPVDILTEYIPQLTNEKQIESVLRGTDYTQQKNPNMPSEILEKLSHHPKDTIRYLVALYHNASVNTLRRLAVDPYRLVRQTVAENPNTPPDILIEMAKDSQNQLNTRTGSAHSVAYKIAVRKDAPAEALDYIAKMPVSTVRITAVRNDKISLKTLEWLVDNNSNENVLSLIAQNHKITPQIQEKLASNPSVKVRQSLASNSNATSDTLTIIALTMITEETNIEVHKALASHPNTPVNFLENLSEASNSSIRAGVASNPNVPQHLIEKLARDESVEVRHAVVSNPNISESIRDSLEDLLPVAKTTTQPTSPTLRGLSRIYNPDTDDLPTVLSEYVDSDVPLVRFVSLLHPLTPVKILREGSQSISWIERYAVADNPTTSTEIKQQLTHDSNRIVRAVARDRLAA